MLLTITNYSDIDRRNQVYCKYIIKRVLIIITSRKPVFGYTTNEESDTIPMILELENFMINKNMKMDKK